MDFENLEELKTLRARGVLSEEQFERHYNRMAQRVLNDRKEKVRSKNGLVYLLLAYFTGTIGLHNFYAGYYKRGGVQLFLTLISFYMYYIPLLVTAFWALAEFLFNDESAMLRIDMSEYMERHTVSRLVGSPPGYVGHDEGGQLTEKVRRKPYSVVLFDEIEKAHEDVWNIMLQILDDGRITDSQGRTVDFKNTVIVMTSNIGAKALTAAGAKLGFDGSDKKAEEDADKAYAQAKETVMAELRQTFRPEFLNRIDDIIVFRALTEQDIEEVTRRMLKTVAGRMEAMDIHLDASDEAVKELAKEGFDPRYGARPLRRAIQSKVEDAVAVEDDKLVVTK